MSQDLEAVLPVEEEKTYRAAQPVQKDGRVMLKQELIEAREDAQVKTILAGGPFALVILGGSHDLADIVERLADGKCELIVVETSEFRKRSGSEGH